MTNKRNILRKTLFWIVRFVSLSTMVYSIIALAIGRNDESVPNSQYVAFMLQSLALFACTFVPLILERIFKIHIPMSIELIYLVFVTLCILFGEIFNYYVKYSWWDDILHTFSGSFIASLALMDVYFLKEKRKDKLKLSPEFIIIFCFCFAMTGCLIWEVFEFTADGIFGSNMQRFRDNYTGVPFEGREALKDTMGDLIEGLIGATIFCIISYFDVRRSNKSKIVQMFDIEPKNQIKDNNDTKVEAPTKNDDKK